MADVGCDSDAGKQRPFYVNISLSKLYFSIKSHNFCLYGVQLSGLQMVGYII